MPYLTDGRFQIEHSGGKWTSLGIGPHGADIWPIEELFARSDFTPEEQDKIRAAHPNGKEEGQPVLGLDDG